MKKIIEEVNTHKETLIVKIEALNLEVWVKDYNNLIARLISSIVLLIILIKVNTPIVKTRIQKDHIAQFWFKSLENLYLNFMKIDLLKILPNSKLINNEVELKINFSSLS